jgi:UDP-glucose 4-epimerase
MAILVTGATGFIGSRLVERLVADGQRVVGITRNRDSALGLTNPLIKWIFQDLAEDEFPMEALVGVTSVVHLAGETLGAGEDEMTFLRANEQTTIKIAKSLTSSVDHFIYASTQGVYGDAKNLAVAEDFPLSSTGSAYACSKLNSENWLRWFQKRNGGSYISLRFCGFIEGGGIINYIVNQAIANQDIELFSNGAVARDYLPISAGLDAIIAALNYSPTQGYVPINIGSGQVIPALEIANIICTELKSVSQIRLLDVPSPQGDFVFCIDRAKSLLAFTPENLENSIRSYSISQKHRREYGDIRA